MEPSMLERLRNYAEAHADEVFPLGSCTECLAARMTGVEMDDHDNFVDGTRVPTVFARLTEAAGDYRQERGYFSPTSAKGALLARAIDAIIAGRHPTDAARDMMDAQLYTDDLNAVGSPM